MAIDRLRRPPAGKLHGVTKSKPAKPARVEDAAGADGLAPTQTAPKVDTGGGPARAYVPRGSGSSVQGDWLPGGRQTSAELFAEKLKNLAPGGAPALVGPPKGATVAKPGEQSLIGLKDDYFDPKASYEENLATLKREGIPRFALLSEQERAHETAFIDAVMKDPETHLAGAGRLALEEKPPLPMFEVDAMKRLYDPYGRDKKPASADERALRLEINHALHPTAVAVARLAFLKQLDELAKLPDDDPHKSVMVTCGGCAAGKSDMFKMIARLRGDLPFGAVWDAAGEGDARENQWILEACKSRGITAQFGFAAASPMTRYNDVLARSEAVGRVVDVATFTNSYVEGSKNMKAFMESPQYKAAEQSGWAHTLVVDVGEYDTKTRTYPDAHAVREGEARSSDIPTPPPTREVFAKALEVLEGYAQRRAEQGKSNTEVLTGALVQAAKFVQMGAV
jgi:hypothetical protein